jgi:hypothetical protein
MTPTGRRTVILVRPVHVTARPDWPAGPLPLSVGDLVTTTQTRSTYFSGPCNRILYGSSERPSRWHLPYEAVSDEGLFGVELLVPDPDGDPDNGVVVVHLADPGDTQLDLLRAAAGRRSTSVPVPDLASLLKPFAVEALGVRTFTVAFKSGTEPLASPPGIDERLGWSPERAWLWQLASRSNALDHPPDPEYPERPFGGTVVLSADWRALVTRDGAAFVALRPDQGADDPFLNFAHLYTHTTYLDALLLGMIQRASVERMVVESAAAFDAKDMQRHLERIEQRAARFRTIYWLRDASSHGHANSILDAYHAQHELPERFDAVLSEIADLARIVQGRDAERIGAALGVLTVVGLPFGAALETLQALGASSLSDLVIGLIAAFTTTCVLLTTRIGRLLIRQIRSLR